MGEGEGEVGRGRKRDSPLGSGGRREEDRENERELLQKWREKCEGEKESVFMLICHDFDPKYHNKHNGIMPNGITW